MNSDDDGPFNSTSFDIKILHSLTMNYHSTPPASLHRVTFDMMRTLGISERCFGVHTREPSTTTFPAGRPLVHVTDYLLLSSFARSSAPASPQGSHSPGPPRASPAPPFGAGHPDRFVSSPLQGSQPRGYSGPRHSPPAGPLESPHRPTADLELETILRDSPPGLTSILRSSFSGVSLSSSSHSASGASAPSDRERFHQRSPPSPAWHGEDFVRPAHAGEGFAPRPRPADPQRATRQFTTPPPLGPIGRTPTPLPFPRRIRSRPSPTSGSCKSPAPAPPTWLRPGTSSP